MMVTAMYSKIICVVLVVCVQHSSSQTLYEQAKEKAAARWATYEKLYEQYNLPPTDYAYGFNVEFLAPTLQNNESHVLLEYQRLVRTSGHCPRMNYKQCLVEYAKGIPLNERCQIADGPCNPNDKYSQINGQCNNLIVPTLAKANTPYSHWLESAFADGVIEIRKSTSHKPLPNPREIGNKMARVSNFKCNTVKCNESTNNFASVMFGQLITHDVSSRKAFTMKGNRSHPIGCCNSANSGPLQKNQINPNCIPIRLPLNDPFYADKGIFCQPFYRMQTTLESDCAIKTAHENVVTHFLDLSQIYSNDEDTLKIMRANDSGRFQMDPKNICPLDKQGNFLSGDARFRQTVMLSLMHSIFHRSHNVIADNLKLHNPHWGNDQVFLESRRLNIAFYQHIIYSEWLPLVVDKNELLLRKVICGGESNPCDEYDANIDPRSMVEFANAAFRVFHANVPSNVYLANATYDVIEELTLSDSFGQIDLLPDNYNEFLQGLLRQRQRNNRVGYSGEVRNLFFKTKLNGKDIGIDLHILDTMRDRDSGSARFVDFYGPCMEKRIQSWHDLKPYFETKHFTLLKLIYEDYKDVDLMAGLLLEKRHKNYIGKIGACILSKQFHRYRYGDRFFYSHSNSNPHPFTADQLNEIMKMTFSKLICMTTTIEQLPRHGFVALSEDNPPRKCSTLGSFNFDLFKEK